MKKAGRLIGAMAFMLPALAASPLLAQGTVPGGVPETAQSGYAMDDEARTVVKKFLTAYGDVCMWDQGARYFAGNPPPRWALDWDTEWSDEQETLTLYQFYCSSGAYNISHIYYVASQDPWEGVQPVHFAYPEFTVINEDPDDLDSAVADIVVEGMSSRVRMVNSVFDPVGGTVTDHSLWRGLGDASSTGTWRFDRGRFVLVSYDVDASYDGEVRYDRIVDFTGNGAAQ